MKRSPFALVLALAAGSLAAIPDTVTGCAAVPHRSERVDTSDEGALIIWDEKSKTEHFIRRANFRSTGYDFGFLVPTPNRPELDVASDELFSELASITAPRVEHREVVQEVEKEFAFGCTRKATFEFVGAAMPQSKAATPGGVEVLEQKRVGDYDATVLAFRKGDGDTPERGAAELEKWLVTHGYESPPAVKQWLAKYVQDGWCVTAFKIAAPAAKEGGPKKEPPQVIRRDLRAKPIRMSFKADRPFYPYREPETDPATRPANESRLLRVFLAAPVRYVGKLGDGAKPWPGQTVWSGPVDAARWSNIFHEVGLTELKEKDGKPVPATPTEGFWLTEFEDRSSPRPGTDEVYFEPSADASAVERPPVIVNHTKTVVVTPWWHLAVYIGVPTLLVLGGLGIWRLARRQ